MNDTPDEPSRETVRRWWLGAAAAWLVLWAAVLVANREVVWGPGQIEDGDYAANALQVRDAKSFGELYGNYSRWGFRHPGPFFFYAHAAGEVVLVDLLGVVRTPYQAHLVAAAGVHTAFWVAAVALLAWWWREPLLAVAGAGAGLVHFTFVAETAPGVVVAGIWPPVAVLFPQLLFLVACAALASGVRWVLPVLVFAGSVLVHGHVAQPLFVVPLSGAALAWALVRAWRERAVGAAGAGTAAGGVAWWARWRAPGAVAGAVLAVGVLPLVLDAARGAEGNLAKILEHFRSGSAVAHGAGTALGYVLSFLMYSADQDTRFAGGGPGLWPLVRERLPFVLGWVAAAGAGAVAAVAAWRSLDAEERRARVTWLAILGGAWVLSWVWALRQDGPLFQFNSFFQFGLAYAVLLTAVGSVLAVLRRRPAIRTASAGILVAMGVVAVAIRPSDWRTGGQLPDWTADVVREAAAAERAPGVVVVLIEQETWPAALMVVNQLDRAGRPWRVPARWGFMAGEEAVWDAEADEVGAFWRVVSVPGGRDLGRDRWLVRAEPPVAGPGDAWSFAAGAGPSPVLTSTGLSAPEAMFTWTEGRRAAFAFRPETVERDVGIVVRTGVHLSPPRVTGQRWRVRLNGVDLGEGRLEGDAEFRVVAPAAVWRERPVAVLVIDLPDAVSPRSLGAGRDARELGLSLRSVSFE